MIRRFLSLFQAYRDFEAELAECAARAIKAEDKVREWQAKWEQAIDERTAAWMKLSELEQWKADLASHSEATEQPQPLRRTARELQQEANIAARKDALERRRKLMSTVPE